MLKITTDCCESRVTCFSRLSEFTEAKKTCNLSLINFLLWSALQQKLYHQDSKTLIIWSAFCYNALSDTPVYNKRTPDQLNKERRWHLGYIVDVLNCFELPMFIINTDCQFRGNCVQQLNIFNKLIGIFSLVWFLRPYAKNNTATFKISLYYG